MTFYDWAMSEYFDSSCQLHVGAALTGNLRDNIIEQNISPGDSITISYGAGIHLEPSFIYT